MKSCETSVTKKTIQFCFLPLVSLILFYKITKIFFDITVASVENILNFILNFIFHQNQEFYIISSLVFIATFLWFWLENYNEKMEKKIETSQKIMKEQNEVNKKRLAYEQEKMKVEESIMQMKQEILEKVNKTIELQEKEIVLKNQIKKIGWLNYAFGPSVKKIFRNNTK
tara:strand:- start:45 stop:554 length:510 start_codon:yes stop_codon:yes gene_type:complete